MTHAFDVTEAARPSGGPLQDEGRGETDAPAGRSLPTRTNNAMPALPVPALEIRPATILKVLGYCLSAVVVLHLLAMVARFGFGHDRLMGLIPLFNLEEEKNVPTYFSSFQLLVAAVLLGVCAAQHRAGNSRYYKHWLGLALIMLYMSIDETATIHEKTLVVTRELLGTSGLFYYAWVIPFDALALLVVLIYVRFVLALPIRTAVIFALSGAGFMMGATGLEMFEGMIDQLGGYSSLGYMALVTVEEILEMVSVYAFIYAVLDYLTGDGRRIGMTLAK